MLYTLGWIVLGVTCGAILLLIGAGYVMIRLETRRLLSEVDSRGKKGMP